MIVGRMTQPAPGAKEYGTASGGPWSVPGAHWKVTVYPYPVQVDYANNRVMPLGKKASAVIKFGQ